MTIDDESLLSAYMDGQLSPDRQQLVESAMIADPQLGEELRRLSLVRDLVAGLSHDASVDVSTAVLRRLRRKSRVRMSWSPMPFRAPSLPGAAWAGGMLGAAAVLLIGLLLTFAHVVRPPAARGPAAPLGDTVAALDTTLSPWSTRMLECPNHYGPHSLLIRPPRAVRARRNPRTARWKITTDPCANRAASSM